MALKDARPRLAYYASKIAGKETWSGTDEGYRIYQNVPIARTGSQNYLGREIKKNPGYDPEWNIGDEDVVTVYRPESEVLAPEAIASFEGKSVLDEHPPDPQVLIDATDEFDGISKGHAQNVRAGERMPDGEIGPVADLWVKHPELNLKIEGGVRDVSCGYTFWLAKDDSGKFVMTKIRGNHIAVVPNGRAGRLYGIGDHGLELPDRRISMSKPTFLERIQAIGFKAFAADAKPEELAEGVAEMQAAGAKDADEPAKKAAEKEDAERDKAAKDSKRRAARDAEEHPAKCKCDDCMDKGEKDEEFGRDEMTDADELEKEEKKKKEKEGGDDAEAAILPSDEHSKSEFSAGDAAKHLLALRPVIAKCRDKGAKDAYNALCKGVREVRAGAKDSATDPFSLLTNIISAGGVNDEDPELPMFKFFNGVSHADGLKAWNEYQDRRRARK